MKFSGQRNQLSDDKTYLLLKRIMDILLSLLGIIILSPVMVLIALCIKLEDPRGPIIFLYWYTENDNNSKFINLEVCL